MILLTNTEAEMEKVGQVYTIEEAIEAVGFGKFQLLLLAYAGMGWAAEAMEMMLLSFVGPAVQSEWRLSSRDESLITSVVFAGILIGAYSGGVVSDRYGRRKGFLATAVVTFGAGFLSSLAPNYIALILLRGLVGIGLGGGPVLSSWFLEFIPAPHRGFWMVVLSAFWTFGTIFEASLAWLVMPGLGWRWLLAFSSLPSFFLLLFYRLMPESPLYLYSKGREEEASRLLFSIADTNRTELPPGCLVSGRQSELCVRSAPEDEHLLRPSTDHSPAAAPPPTGPCGPASVSAALLLSPKFARPILLLWAVFFGNAFSYYGLVLLTSRLGDSRAHCGPGPPPPAAESNEVRRKDVLVTSFAELPGLVLSATVVDRLGRKLSMAGMFFLCCVFLLPLAFHLPRTLTTGLLFGARVCITCTFTVVYIYAPEIYPTAIRTTGVGVASSVGRIGGMLCPLVAVGLVRVCMQSAAVLLFAAVAFPSPVSTMFFPFDAKGRWLDT